MADLRISARAERDLTDIGEYGTRMFGAAAALRHLEQLAALFDLLCDHPRAGEARSAWGRGIRALSCRPHRILYRISGETVTIVRIVHVSRDVRHAMRSNR